MSFGGLNQGGVTSVKNFLNQPAEAYGNDASLELKWAIQAYDNAELYFNIINTVDPKHLKLSKVDDLIYAHFRRDFPDLNVEHIDVDAMKSTEGKAKWREFCNAYEKIVDDFNKGYLLRIDSNLEVSDANTTFAPRIQFLAIEVARNREGYNSEIRRKFGVSKQDSTSTES